MYFNNNIMHLIVRCVMTVRVVYILSDFHYKSTT